MPPSTIKSSPYNRLHAIQDAMLQAHQDAVSLSRSSLNRMPEYFMAVRVADYFARHFVNFGYRLEAPVKRTFDEADLRYSREELLEDPELRPNGRFDLVLHTGKSGRPAHVIEFKRGARLEHLWPDVRRLARVCEYAGPKRLRTNYLVVTRRCAADGSGFETVENRLLDALDDLREVNAALLSSEPMTPYIDRDGVTVEGSAFRSIIIELTAAD